MFLQVLLNYPKAVYLLVATVMLAGVLMVLDLPVKLYPNINKTRINVRIPHPSFTAEDFAQQYHQTIKEALASVSGIEAMELTYNNGGSSVTLWFDWGVEGDTARSLVSAAMAQAVNRLPDESDKVEVRYWGGRSAGFYSMAVYSETHSAVEVYALVEPLIKPRLERIKNIDIARITAPEEIRADIILDPMKMLELGLNADEIANAIRRSYRNQSLGSFQQGRQVISVRIAKDTSTFQSLENIVIKTSGSTVIKLKDMAQVKVYQGLPRQLFTVNGEAAVVIFAAPNQDGNIRDLAQEMNTITTDLKSQLPAHIKFQKLVDPEEFINTAINNVISAGLIGGSLAILITFLFLGEFRNTLLIAAAIPLSLIMSFVFLHLFDITINLISLSGMTIAVGMIVDAAIVVAENVSRHLQENPQGDRVDAIINAVHEVRGSIVASTITSIVVFLPISFTSHMTAGILGDLSKAVVFVLTSSLIVALLVTPVIAVNLLDRSTAAKKSVMLLFSNRLYCLLCQPYEKALRQILKTKARSALMIGIPFGVLGLALIFLAPKIRREILAKPDSPRLLIDFTNTEVSKPEELLLAIKPYATKIMEKYGERIDNLFARIRRASSGAFTMTLKSTELRDETLIDLQEDLKSAGAWRFVVERWDPADLPLPEVSDLRLSFTGPDSFKVVQLMREAMELIRKSELYADVSSLPTVELPSYLELLPRFEIISAFPELSLDRLGEIGRITTSGRRVVEIVHKEEPYLIDLSFGERFLQSKYDVERIPIQTSQGTLPFSHFFDVREAKGLREIFYEDQSKVFKIEATMKEDTPKWQRQDLENKVLGILQTGLTLEDGYRYTAEDTQAEINEAINSLILALGISLFLIYVVLGAQFNSLVAPLVIMSAVPLGLIGVVGFLFLAESTLSLNSMLGTILLAGIVVNNSIMLLDFYGKLRKKLRDPREALMQACLLRLRPILITTLTTILGMMPIALALGEGSNVIQPLGIAVAGGLAVSTILTVLVIPAFINVFTPPAKGVTIDA